MGKIKEKPPRKSARAKQKFGGEFLEKVPGYEELRAEAERAFHCASKQRDLNVLKTIETYLVGVIQACELWHAFQRADRFRVEDRPNGRAPGKIAGQNSVVKILGLSRNGVYARLESIDLRPEDFGGLESADSLVRRSDKLQSLRSELRAYCTKKTKPR